jgi:hypothetical protein
MSETAPVALFTYKRATHTAKTLARLAANALAADTDLTIFCDGPRSEQDRPAVEEVRSLVRGAEGFRSVRVVERPANLGLARSIISGVTEMVEEYGRVIVVEDDLVTSSHFLRFMNDGLHCYAEDDRVVSLCGYRHPVGDAELPETFFLRGAFCWGWATWRRGWALFEHDPRRCIREIDRRNLIHAFDIGGSVPYTQFLMASALGKGDSWAMRWMASAIIHGKLTLYPGHSLVRNIGDDSSGTNAGTGDTYDTPIWDAPVRVGEAPVREDGRALDLYRRFHLRARIAWSRSRAMYGRIEPFLPAPIERRVYSALIRRSLRRNGVL